MKGLIFVLGFLISSAIAQDVVQVVCLQDAITAKIQKEVVRTAGYEIGDVHLNDKDCVFDEEDDEFFIKTISPFSSCGTHYISNDTHVEFSNSISTVETGPAYPYGVVIGSLANNKVLSALISCTYRIDLNVSTMFIPNITIIPIRIPDAFGKGQFQAAMALYTDSSYTDAYPSPPTLDADATIYVGVNLLGQASQDIYLLMQDCWGTVSDDPNASPQYPLLEDGCAIASAGDGLIRVAENGISHQGLWNAPVFKFVGEDPSFNNVWLHCDLQLCINEQCRPQCDAKRRRRAAGSVSENSWGPPDFNEKHVISFGPITRFQIEVVPSNETKTVYVERVSNAAEKLSANNNKPKPAPTEPAASSVTWSLSIIIVVAVLAALALICIILALVVVILRLRGRSSNSGFNLTGVVNKGFDA